MVAQDGIFAEGNGHHWFAEFTVSDPSRVGPAVADLLTAADGRSPNDAVEAVVAFGPALASDVLGDDLPEWFGPFAGVRGPTYSAPATEADLWVWVHSDRPDRNFDTLTALRRSLGDAAAVVGDVPAFVYHDSRDLTGFIDGTENPSNDEGRVLAVVSDGPGSGGALVFVQRWVHDLDRFHALPEPDQERVIGRTKPDSVELEDLPADSHVGRVVIEDDAGDEIEIYRRSVPYARLGEAGLYFVAFPGRPEPIEQMLTNMFGVEGPHDRVVEFSRAVSGAYLFAPSREALKALATSR